MCEVWYKCYCPKYETINRVCNGDESNLSCIDIIGYKCRKCENTVSFYDMTIENYDKDNFESGLEIPD